MEKLKLPPGFRFHPTDEELVFQYLKSKVFSCPLPAPVISEVDVDKFDPWDFPGCFLFFCFSILSSTLSQTLTDCNNVMR